MAIGAGWAEGSFVDASWQTNAWLAGGGDAIAPTLSSAVIAANGTTLTLTFNETVNIGAGGNGGFVVSPSGGASAASYASGDGTTTLVYTLARALAIGETLTLAYTQPTDGIEDDAGNDLANFSGQAVTNNSTQDQTAPTLSTAVIAANGTTLTLTFNENVNIGAGGNGGFSFSLSGGAASASYASGDGTTALVYTLNRTIGVGETGSLSYTQPGNGIEDDAGNDLATLLGASITNNSTQDVTAPTLSSAVVSANGTTLTLTFDENVNIGAGGNAGFVPDPSGGASAATYSSGDGTTTLVYTLARTLEAGETLTLDYTQPTNGIEDDSGNDLASFSDQAVANNSTQDTTAPLLSSARVTGGGDTLTLVFSEAVNVGAGGNGGFVATMSGGAAALTYASGDGSGILVYSFARTIDGAETGTLAYTQPTNGIEDDAGNDLASFAGTAIANSSGGDRLPFVQPAANASRMVRSVVDDAIGE